MANKSKFRWNAQKVNLAGCVWADLTTEEINQWETYIQNTPEFVDIWNKVCAQRAVLAQCKDEQDALWHASESTRLMFQAGTYARAWLTGLDDRRRAEDEAETAKDLTKAEMSS